MNDEQTSIEKSNEHKIKFQNEEEKLNADDMIIVSETMIAEKHLQEKKDELEDIQNQIEDQFEKFEKLKRENAALTIHVEEARHQNKVGKIIESSNFNNNVEFDISYINQEHQDYIKNLLNKILELQLMCDEFEKDPFKIEFKYLIQDNTELDIQIQQANLELSRLYQHRILLQNQIELSRKLINNDNQIRKTLSRQLLDMQSSIVELNQKLDAIENQQGGLIEIENSSKNYKQKIVEITIENEVLDQQINSCKEEVKKENEKREQLINKMKESIQKELNDKSEELQTLEENYQKIKISNNEIEAQYHKHLSRYQQLLPYMKKWNKKNIIWTSITNKRNNVDELLLELSKLNNKRAKNVDSMRKSLKRISSENDKLLIDVSKKQNEFSNSLIRLHNQIQILQKKVSTKRTLSTEQETDLVAQIKNVKLQIAQSRIDNSSSKK